METPMYLRLLQSRPILAPMEGLVATSYGHVDHRVTRPRTALFCLSMRGSRTLPRETWLALFEGEAGFRMGVEGWTHWEAFNLFKGACANSTCLRLFESGANRAPNMAIIGTVLHRSFLRRMVDVVHR